MTYRVFYTDRVTAQVAAQVDYLREQHVSDRVIEAWFLGLFDAIDDLYDLPRRFPVDQPESERQGFEVRKLTFRRYTVRYRVDEERRVVEVLSFIHGSMRREA